MSSRKLLISSVIIFSVVLFDQATKILALSVGLTTICNQGFAFGIGQGWFSLLTTPIVIVAVSVFLIGEGRRSVIWGYSLIIGGGMSNLLDRFAHGCVIDFVNLKIWPSFNLADVAITMGVCLVLFQALNLKWIKN